MRILHTSDWHLGQHFMGKTRQAEHQSFCTWLLEQVRVHEVDAVIIAGDVFDTGSPPSYAREQYFQLVEQMHEIGCTLVVLAGNHDSPAMLGESRNLLGRLGTFVLPQVMSDPVDQVLLLRDRTGAPGAVLCAIPYIRPRDVLTSQAGQSAQDKQAELQNAIAAHYQRLHQLAEQLRQQQSVALPIIATGHLTTVGASVSDSVREIYVGTLEAFPSNAFAPADYIALGHIHRPQKVGGLEHIRYCGSPIALSFDEAQQQKQVLLVEFAQGALASVSALAVPSFQALVSLQGNLAELKSLIAQAATQGSLSKPVWLDVQVVQDDFLSDLQSAVHQLCDGLAVEVLRIRRARHGAVANLSSSRQETLDELSLDEVFARRLVQEQLEPAAQGQLTKLYRQVVDELSQPQVQP